MSSESDGAIYGELHSAHEPAPAVEAPRKAAKKSVRFDETPTIVNYEPQVEYTPTPSVRTKEQGSRFRVTLWVLLLIHTIRFIVLADSIAVINFGLLFVGFYGQDLLRVTALRLYFWGNVVSMGANVVHAGVQFFNSTEENSTHTHLALLLGGLFFIAEAVPKIVSIIISKRMVRHLIERPGQSI